MTEEELAEAKRRVALVESGDLEGALASIDAEIASRPNDTLLYRERAHLYLYLGQTRQARSDFDTTASLEAEASRTRTGRLHSDGAYNAIGVTYWMEGQPELALAFWRYTTRMLTANHVSYAHMGGGIESGLLLWFGAVHQRNAADIELVRQFFEQRLASKFWSHGTARWPGPIGRFFLDQCTEEALVESASDDLQALSQAHFALAARAREQRRHAAYRKHLRLTVPQNKPQEIYAFYNAYSYFIARVELAKVSR